MRFPRFPLLGAAILCASVGFAPSTTRAECIDYGDYIRFMGFPTYGGATGAAHGDYAYMSENATDLRAYDVSDPLAPVPGGVVEMAGWPLAFEISGSVLFLGTYGGVRVVSLAAPMAPVVLDMIETSDGNGLAVVGNLLYVAGWEALRIYDVTDPSNAAFVSTVALPGVDLLGVAVSQGYAYASTTNGVRIIDVAPAASAHAVGSFGSGLCRDLEASFPRLYVSGEPSLRIYSLINPAAPQLLGSIPEGTARLRSVVGGLAYLSSSLGAMIVDVSQPTAPEIITLAASGAPAIETSLLVYPNHLFYGGLTVFDTSITEASPPVLVTDLLFPAAQASERYGDQLFVAAGAAGLRVYDLVEGAAPALSAVLPSINAADLSIDWPLVCVATTTGLAIVDAGTPGQLLLTATALPGVSTTAVAAASGRAFVTTSGRVYAFDLSNPASPAELANMRDGSFKELDDVVLSGDAVYVSGRYDDIIGDPWSYWVLDVSALPSWQVTSQFGGVRRLAIAGSHGYASLHIDPEFGGDTFELVPIDLSNPLYPDFGASIRVRNWGELELDGSRLYHTQRDRGVEVFDLSDPMQPVSIGQSRFIDEARDAVVVGQELYVTSSAGGLTVLPTQCPSVVAAPELIGTALSLRASPNPAFDACRLSFALPRAGDATVSLHDAAGRLVRTLALGSLAAGVHEIEWDGRGDSGLSAPSGIYFARLRGIGVDASSRVVLRR